MGKAQKRHQKEISSNTKAGIIPTLTNRQQDFIFLTVITILLLILLKPLALDGLSPQGVDVVGLLGQTHQIHEYAKETGESTLWNPNVFGGMPQYHRKGPVTFSIDSILIWFSEVLGRVFIFYLFAAFGIYALLRYLKMSPMISFVGTIMFILLPHYKSLYIEGHMSKFRALMITPWILLSFLYFLDKRTILSAALFAVIFGAQIRTHHYQIVFYTALLIFSVGIYPMLKDIFDKRYQVFGKSILLLFTAITLGLTMSAQPLFVAKEYLPYSKRGKTTINLNDKNKVKEKLPASQGVSIEYATQWSTHPTEILTWMLPRFYGGMSGEKYSGKEVPQLKNRVIPGYWGHMPFTQSYEYIGVLSLLLSFIGIYAFRKDFFIRGLLILAIFLILLSFGRHFSLFYGLFFDYLPFFNKFRAPVMSVTMTSFIVAILAAYGLRYLSELPAVRSMKENKPIMIIAGSFIGLGILLLITGHSLDFSSARDNYDPKVLEMIKTARQDMFTQDLIRYFVLVVLAGAALFGYLKKKISFSLMVLVFTVLIGFDLIDIQSRYHKKYINVDRLEKQYFKKTATDNFLVKDKEIFRVFPLGKMFGDNRWAYYHQTIGGYSAIKMYPIEEIIANNIYKGWDKQLPINYNILKILNVKYLIAEQKFSHEKLKLVSQDTQGKLYTYLYLDRLNRGFFVENYKVMEDEYDRLAMLNNPNFDPAVTALLEEKPDADFGKPDSSWVHLESFSPNKVSFNAYSDKQSLLVVSEMDYPPGWKAYIDNKTVSKIYKTNHAIQSILFPPGEHKVDFRFEPESFYKYIKISYASASILYIAILLSLIFTYKERFLDLLNRGKSKQ